MAGNRIVALVIEVADLERSARLYREAFGVEVKPAADHGGGDRYTSGLHCAVSWKEGAFLHFALYQTKDGTVSRNAQIGISVDDLDAAHVAACAAGAEVVHEPRPEEWGRSARYRDLDGNVIELTQPA